MASVDFYLMTCERIEFLDDAIQSINQAISLSSSHQVNFVVSDNSATEKVNAFISERYPDIKIIRRPSLNVIDHHNVIINEASAEFLVMFHDDDRLTPEFLLEGLKFMSSNPDFSAFASNAFVITNGKIASGRILPKATSSIVFENMHQLLERYMYKTKDGVAPFSGYIYRSASLKGIHLDFSFSGVHSDVLLLLKLLCRGKIFWSIKPLIFYRFHSTNAGVKFLERGRFLNAVRKTYPGKVPSCWILNYKRAYIRRYLVKYVTREFSSLKWPSEFFRTKKRLGIMVSFVLTGKK